MKYEIKNEHILIKLLWCDFILGFVTGLAGIIFASELAEIFGLERQLMLIISFVTLAYSFVAFILVMNKKINMNLLPGLILANWIWAVIGIGIFMFHYKFATTLGVIFLMLQTIVVGGLAYLEGNQLKRVQL